MEIDRLLDAADALDDWRTPYLKHLTQAKLPTDEDQVRRIHRRAKSFLMIEGEPYKRNITSIMQRCIPTKEGIKLLEDIQGGICGHHAATKTIVENAFRQGFYWPTAMADATRVILSYEGVPILC